MYQINFNLVCLLWTKSIDVSDLCYRVPGITIATDIICGFPTETDEVGLCCP